MAVTLPSVQDIQRNAPNAVEPQPSFGGAEVAGYQPGVVAQAETQAGGELRKATDNLQDLQNENTARMASNKFMQDATVLDTQFRQEPNMGAAIKPYNAKYEALQKQLGDAMPPEAAKQFLTDSGSYMSFLHRQMAEGAAQQFKANIDQTSITAMQLALQNPNAPGAAQNYVNASVAKVKNNGGGTEAQSNEAQFRAQEFETHRVSNLPLPDQIAYLTPLANQHSGTNSTPNNLGNVKTPEGAANNTQNFMNPATPVDGAALTANTLRSGYQGLTLAQIAQKWTGEPDKAAQWAATVSKESGIAVGDKPDLNNPQQLTSLLGGMATAEKSAGDRKLFTPDVIQKGVEASLNGTPVNTAANANTKPSLIAPAKAATMLEAAISEQNRMAKLQGEATAQQQQATMNKYVEGKTPITQLQMDDSLTPEQKETTLKVYGAFNRADKNTTQNSTNGYDTILRTLDDADSPNRIVSQSHIDSLLARSDAAGINVKDWTDAKKALEIDPQIKKTLRDNMQQIAVNGGNLDGKGQQRAIDFYNQVMTAWQQNNGKGDKALSPALFAATIGTKDGPAVPSVGAMQQIENWAASLRGNKAQQSTIPMFDTVNDAGFKALPAGAKFKDADGKLWTKR